jgi:tetratricopeptide (TPR) repeat protein
MTERIRIWLLAGAAGIVYANTLANGFVYDDGYYVVGNPAVTTFNLPGLFRAMSSNHVFRPLTGVTWAVNWAIGGAQPFGYHLVNVLLHMTVSVLVYLVLRKLLEGSPHADSIAFVAALIFAVHPIHTEAVAWIAGRGELMAAGFLLGAWLLHLGERPVWAVVCFALALLSKESAVVFVPLVVMGDYARGAFKSLYRYTGICCTAGGYVALLWWVQGRRFDKGPYTTLDNALANLPATWRVLNALRVAWKYVGLQVYPATLSNDYSYNAIHLYADWKHTLPLALVTAAVLAVWGWAIWKKRSAWILVGGIYVLGFAVTANILVSTGTIMGERLAYLPSVGFCLLVALLWVRLGSGNKRIAISVLGVLVLLLGLRTMARNRDWKDDLTLFSADVRAVPGSARAHGLLGQEYLRRGDLVPAEAELRRAITLFPDYSPAMENYGLVEARLGHEQAAKAALEKAVVLTRKDDSDYNFRAITLAAWLWQHDEDEVALEILNQVIADSPGEARAWSNRAVVRYRRGDLAKAKEDAETALRLDAGNTQAQGLLSAMNGAGAEQEGKKN